MFFVYAIQNQINKDLYIGYTTNLDKRVAMHNAGKVKSTKAYKPWELIYFEGYKEKLDATIREKQLKKSFWKHELKNRLGHSLTQ